jgi:hypothetical protein
VTRRAALLAALLPTLVAAAPPPLQARVESRRGVLAAAVDLRPAFPPELERLLGNGLTNVVAIHVALAPARGGDPVAVWAREVQVLYDVWEETYGAVVRDPQAPRGRRHTFRTFEELRAFLADARVGALGPSSALGDDAWVLTARVELNPVSKELLERTRELIANPATGTRGGGPSRSVLGAMASYLLREPPPGGEVRVLRSRPFGAAEVTAR